MGKRGDTFDLSRVTWVWSPADLMRLKAILPSVSEIAWDLETTGLVEHREHSKITVLSLTFMVEGASEPDTWLVPLYHPESPWLGSWRNVARSLFMLLAGKFLMAHNGKFDCRWAFHHTGIDLSHSLMWDSAHSEHLLDENRSYKLKPACERTFGVERWDDFDLTAEGATLRLPLIDLGFYAARDTYWTWRLGMVHLSRMWMLADADEERPEDTDEIEEARFGLLMQHVVMPTARTMASIEQRGIALDEEWTRSQVFEYETIRDQTRTWLCKTMEVNEADASFAPTSHWFIAFTEKAVERGHLRVAAVTKGGKPQWSKEVLGKQARLGSEVAQNLLEHRRAIKKLEYLNAWLGYLRSDGAIHASYNVGSLITGRLSSSDPNMQQVTKPLRPCFVPRPGYVMVDFDYSQIELRVAAFMARCLPMIEAFIRGDDLHRLIAARITSKPPEEVTDTERQGGKAGNFGFLFGQTPYGFKFYAENQYGVVFDDAGSQAVYDAFFKEWKGMREWHQDTLRRAHRTGQVVSPLGRIRRLPGLFGGSDGAIKHAENAALNAPVQGFASDIMQIAAAMINGTYDDRPPVEGINLVATVHDSIVGEVLESRWEEIVAECVEIMTKGVLDVLAKMDCHFDVPLVAEATIGTRWGLKDIGEVA
jgi:DNA polymerase-1